jgi:Putative adhesin
MSIMQRKQRIATWAVVTILLVAAAVAAAETTRKELHFKVGRRASVSIVNQYGPISVKPGPGKRVAITAIVYSGKVEVDHSKRGNRVSVFSHLLDGADADSGRVDYEVLVPADASVTLHSTTGPLHVEKLHGDVTLEGSTAVVDVRDVSAGHVHIKTLNGPVTISNVSDGYVEVTSVAGDVALTAVNGPQVNVNSSTGRIRYDGDFGDAGQYSLTSHSGDIEAIAPSYASIEVVARSVQGKVQNDFPLEPEHTTFVTRAGSAFAGTVGKAASSVKLLSFSGKIHLKKREQ